MDAGFTEEQELLRETARDFLAARTPMARVREVMAGPETLDDAAWRELIELGWTGLVFPEAFGGSGLGLVELCVVLEELGRALAPVPFLPTVLAGLAIGEAGDPVQQAAWLGRICTGETAATFAITEARGSDDRDRLAARALRVNDGWQLDGCKLFVPDAAVADVLVVVAKAGEGDDFGLFAIPRKIRGLTVAEMASIDPLRPIYEVHFDGVRLPADARLGGDRDAWPVIERVLDLGRVMISAEMIGGAQKCLEDAVAYAKQREQFGRPIGANQGIQYKCADLLTEVESAKSLTYYAAWAARSDDAATTAAMAKAYVSDAYLHAAEENIQIHGGVGFTWEYDCHLYFKRARSDGSWLGDATCHRRRVARLIGI
jgi:alkylation response protein AidB-like acyl-CoA dehydrogenase